jgi:hypothetical protein
VRDVKKERCGISFCVWLLILTLWTTTVLPLESDVEVVLNDSVEQRVLSVTTLRAIFGMRLRTWPDGTAIQVYVLYDDSPLHLAFCKKVLNIFPHQMRLAWDRLVFSGTGQAPHQVNSEKEMLFRVATTPGAIGYLGEAMIDENLRVPAIRY